MTKKISFLVISGLFLFSLVAGSVVSAQGAAGDSCGACYNNGNLVTPVISCTASKFSTCGTTPSCGACPSTNTNCATPAAVAITTCGAGTSCNPDTLICTRIADIWGPKDVDVLAAQAGLGTDDPREIVSNVINVIIGFLGIIAVVLIIAGGFMWMTAAGNDDKISTSKKMMTAGVIGLVILLAAFGISKFVVEALLGATGA